MTYTLDGIKIGDTVVIQREVTVASKDTLDGTFATTDHRTIRVKQRSWGYSGNLPCFTITEIKKSEPANWPPSPGDVWEDDEGYRYVITGGAGGAKAYSAYNDVLTLLPALKLKTGIKRIFGGN